MYKKSAFVFWVTLALYLITLFTVSYVGVYLTYFALPVIVLSGLAMLFAKPSRKNQETIDAKSSTVQDSMKSTIKALEAGVKFTDELSKKALIGSIKLKLEAQRSQETKLEIAKKEVKIKRLISEWQSGSISNETYQLELDTAKKDISTLQSQLIRIKEECIAEAERQAGEL